MRLLQISGSDELSLVERMPDDLPPYAILSHTWGPSNEEVTYQDLISSTGKEKAGYRKLILCGRQAAQDGFQYFWVDTCCIDKTSSAELSEAINSMYSWYQVADVCYAYLADVTTASNFLTSRWFTRGWTLQELLAPEKTVFFSAEWNVIGTRVELQEQISERTRIPVTMLSQQKSLETFSVAQRMSWAAERKTTRIEDMAYCLLGIFDINMPLIYGEGENAFIRLQEEILKISDDHSIFAWQSTDDRGGCLATSPAAFRMSSDIVQCTNRNNFYDPVILSSKGVHVNVRFMGIGHGKLGFAILDCCKQGMENQRVGIYLRDMSLAMSHLERVMSEELVQIDLEASASSRCPVRRLCIQKTRVKSRRKIHFSTESQDTTDMKIALDKCLQEQTNLGGPRSLLEAVKTGTADDVWLFLTRGDIGSNEINEKDENKQTALSHAAREGKQEVVQILINRINVLVDFGDANERTPMWWAVANGHEAVVKFFLETGLAKVNSADKDGSTPLMMAVDRGDEALTQLLLKVDGINVDSKQKDGLTPLSIAVKAGHEAVTRILLQRDGIDVDSQDREGRTPLSWAVEAATAAAVKELHNGELERRVAIFKMLLETGKANANLRDNAGRTPLSWAAAEPDRRLNVIREPLIQEMVYNETHSIKSGGQTPFFGAVLAGEMSVAKLLLETGMFDVNSKNEHGLSPLFSVAEFTKDDAVAKLLLETVGVDVNVTNDDGRTPLSVAVSSSDLRGLEIVRLLLEKPMIDVNAKDKKGWTPLLWAARQGTADAIGLLLRMSGIDVNAKDKHGRTPLSWAVTRRNYDVLIKLLGSPDIDVNAKDDEGQTPISRSKEAGLTMITNMMRKHLRRR
jgi:ankyrin repeat protein